MKITKTLKNLGICCLLIAIASAITGCAAGPGETKAELDRRHDRVVKTNMLLVQEDLDAVFMLDKPSRASDKLVRP